MELLYMGHAGASRKPPNEVPWETLGQRSSRPLSAYHRHAPVRKRKIENILVAEKELLLI